ncbi:RNA 2',3'-cyclic phosphodiesterase [Nocardioides solisilvae]|uniref:RNA 2',3'-cyclic phosphodiesterase n=1 Tax=Nocardioides solisilvae TaxID=1542435 RepID=UPI000D74CE2A|nr:RNA 2',3'-cyclic phosphodiesterase [Nocardioides solisilvae]
MRLFVAAVPPPEVVEDLDAFLDVRRGAARAEGLRWSLPEHLHVTLAFLADAAERHLDELLERLERAAGRRSQVPTRVAGGGAFPHVAGARVLWAGLELDDPGATELRRMAEGARAAASRTGIAVDGQRFRPHVTLARLRRPTEVSPWVRLLDSYAGPPWTVDTLTLVRSHLGEGPRRRPRYEVLAELPVGR